MRRNRLSVVLVSIAACAAAALSILPGSSAVASSARLEVSSIAKLPLWTAVVDRLAPATRMNLTVSLKPRDPAGLAHYAAAVSDPSSPLFHRYLTVAQFASRFGAAPSAVAAVQQTLRAQGLIVSPPTANNLAFTASGTTALVDSAFRTQLDNVKLPNGRRAFANLTAPTLPASVAGYVQGVIGLDNVVPALPAGLVQHTVRGRYAPVARTLSKPRMASDRLAPHATSHAAPAPCSGIPTNISQNGYTVDQLAAAYGFSGIYQGGNFGAGQTIALVELQAYDPKDIATFDACFGINAQLVSNVTVGPAAPTLNGDDGEAALDIETAQGLAPGANVVVYQADASNAGIGEQAVIMNQIASENKAKSVSTSYGVCEAATPASAISMENTALQQMAAQGQTFFSASGDSGAQTCSQLGMNSGNSNFSTGLSAEDPAAQPFATGVGGTELFKLGPPAQQGGPATLSYYTVGATPQEIVWNEGPNSKCNCVQTPGGGASGGGGSKQWPIPTYQSSYFTASNLTPSAGNTGCGNAQCREVPDIAANADSNTGYVVYVTSNSTPQWAVIGGTSAASPLWAAFLALVNANTTCRGLAVGFANPLLYKIASAGGGSYSSNFRDVQQVQAIGTAQPTNNDQFAGYQGDPDTGNLYPVTAGYDMTTGLGSMVAPALSTSLCNAVAPVYTITIPAPAAQTAITRNAYSLQLVGTDSGGAALTYAATGLPAGLSMSTSGLITGTPTTAGTASVTATATDQFKNSGSVAFPISVVTPGKPTAGVTLGGVAKRNVKVTVSATHGTNAPPLRVIVIGLPSGFNLSHSANALNKGLSVSSLPGSHVTVGISGFKLTLTFATPVSTATINVSSAELGVSKSLAKKVKKHKIKSFQFFLTLTDAAGLLSTGSFTVHAS
ncbi:MAG: S53 family peptidase [Solirubrobacteraceae bacterium]